MKHVDVIIVGGGPAASAMAMYTDERLRVLVVEKRRLLDDDHLYENEKCCGGMLDETAQKTLTRMKIALPENVIAAPQVFSVKAVDFMTGLQRTYQRNYLNIDRVRFDRMLLEKAVSRPNVELMEGTVCYDFMESAEGVAACLRHQDGSTEVIMCSYLVGADGATSTIQHGLRKQTGKGPLREPDIYVSVQEWFDYKEDLPYYMAMFDNQVSDFYSWVIPKRSADGPQIMVGSAMPQKGLKKSSAQERFERMKADLTGLGMDLTHGTKKLGSVILRPKMWGSVWTGESRVFLIGEAAGLISPSSAEGISFALRSGIKLAASMKPAVSGASSRILKKEDTGSRSRRIGKILKKMNDRRAKQRKELLTRKDAIRLDYKLRLISLQLSIALKTLKAPLMYNGVLRNLIFVSRLTSLKETEKSSGGTE